MNTSYYVYILLDPRKYVLQPFYIGKGKNNRCSNHCHPSAARLSKNKLKNGIINKIRNDGLSVIVYKHTIGLTEEQAFELECRLIKRFGRRNNSTGILSNLTDGGEGASGVKFSVERKKDISKKTSGENNPMYGKKHSRDSIEKMKLVKRERIKTGETIPHKHTEEHKASLRTKMTDNPYKGFGKPKRELYKIHPINGIIDKFESTSALAKHLNLKSNCNIIKIASAGCMQYKDGYFYRYCDAEDIVDERILNSETLISKNKGRKIGKFSNNTLVEEYYSIKIASKENHINYDKLWDAIKYGKIINEYEWKYLN